MPRAVWAAIVILVAALTLFTSHKLYTMGRIRGFVGSRLVEQHQVRRRSEEVVVRGQPPRRSRFCFVHWLDGDAEERGQADCAYVDGVQEGDFIDVVRLERFGEPHIVAGEIYASDGNFRFDFILLAGELALLLGCIFGLVMARDDRP
jgi:hypothetical protein